MARLPDPPLDQARVIPWAQEFKGAVERLLEDLGSQLAMIRGIGVSSDLLDLVEELGLFLLDTHGWWRQPIQPSIHVVQPFNELAVERLRFELRRLTQAARPARRAHRSCGRSRRVSSRYTGPSSI